MGLLSFLKEAGEKLFGKDVQAAEKAAQASPSDSARRDEANRLAAGAIEAYIGKLNLPVTALTVTFDGATAIAKVYGVADTQEIREKVLLAAGNVEGVAGVDDNMTVAQPAPQSKFYAVVKGDTLSKIAKEQYGNANDYMRIFEANKPMLTHPDKIYPGQNLRIPPK
jgi:nucleoid-associated protein YgaU